MTGHPDLIIVDINGQTLELLDTVRSGEGLVGYVDPDTPMIVMSCCADRLQRIRLLERGGDDVVKKPFEYRSCGRGGGGAASLADDQARPADVARRAGCDRRARPRGSEFSVVRSSCRSAEYRLLLALRSSRIGNSRARSCCDRCRAIRAFGRTRTLYSHAFRLRRKLCDGNEARLVVNVWGVGYRPCYPVIGDE